MNRNKKESNRACLLGGAIGDALGAAVEFDSLESIRERCGPEGVTGLMPAYGRVGAITDDTQMTLFTAEGVLRAYIRGCTRGIAGIAGVTHHAYLRWAHTQGLSLACDLEPDGLLVKEQRLFERRAPGITCCDALRRAERFGDEAENDSKGCGTVMRVAPIALFFDEKTATREAMDNSRLTHGHPTAAIACGALVRILCGLLGGEPLPALIEQTIDWAERVEPREHAPAETSQALKQALQLANSGAEPTPELIETLGGGWIAEEALAIAVYCALVATSFREGVLLAVNHSGDSDSTGAIAGNLLGLIYGMEGIPQEWLDSLELADLITEIADDLVDVRGQVFTDDIEPGLWDRYPGW